MYDPHAKSWFFLLVFCVVLPACSRKNAENERLQRQWNGKCQEAADLLASVSDAPSAKAAEPRLRVVFQELSQIDEKLQRSYDSADVDPGDRPAMTEEVAKGIAAMQKLTEESLRIGRQPELVAALGSTWKMNPSLFMLESQGAIPKSK